MACWQVATPHTDTGGTRTSNWEEVASPIGACADWAAALAAAVCAALACTASAWIACFWLARDDFENHVWTFLHGNDMYCPFSGARQPQRVLHS